MTSPDAPDGAVPLSDEKAVLGQRIGTPSDTMGVRFEETAEMDLSELDLP